jgi:hypothetical protein
VSEPGASSAAGEPAGHTGPSVTALLRQLKVWAQEGKNPQSTGRDGFPMYAEDPLAGLHEQLDEFLKEVPSFGAHWRIHPDKLPKDSEFLKLSTEDKVQALRAIMVRARYASGDGPAPASAAERMGAIVGSWAKMLWRAGKGEKNSLVDTDEFRPLTSALLRSNLPLTAEDLTHLVSFVADVGGGAEWAVVSGESVLRSVERFAEASEIPPALRQELERWRQSFGGEEKLSSPNRKLFTRIKVLLGQEANPGIVAGEAWSNAAIQDLKQVTAEQRTRWCRLLQHCQQAETSKPTQKWMKTANQLVEDLGRDEFKLRLVAWFELVAFPRPVHQEPIDAHSPDPDQLIADGNSVILKGLAWSCAEWKHSDVTRALSRLAQVCFKKIRNLGARCPRVGNACLYSLSVTATDEAAAELTRLDQVIKQPSTKKLLGKSLDKAAELTGQTREDMEESTVPRYGLDSAGSLKQPLCDFTAEFSIAGPDALELQWRKADGKLQKSVPVEVKEKHAAELKALKRTIQDIEKMLPAQRARIERLLLSEREWEFEKWRERYFNHPLLAHITRRLIWRFHLSEQKAAGIWHEGKIVDIQDRPLDWLSPETRVRLWHPLGQEVDMVAAWRQWLEAHQIVQPFKQAHREIYILTDAEQQTGTYSNRFAAHIIRQHQFAALAKERGWTYRLQGAFDSHNIPTLVLPAWHLAVEFWVDSPGGYEGTSPSGIYLHVATDQVRFCDSDGAPRPLTEVPALVFSEAMRDVDLFVGVCSIGNDPAWQDHGEGGQFGDYWRSFSFGDLSVAAKTRREVLERLLPRLKIASQCSLQDKFLVVRGSLRTYKIHLGSSNILMEPNDQYLCIVPDRSAGFVSSREISLPFEGDNQLAVILSKAFLLAADDKIKDQTILHQIRAT